MYGFPLWCCLAVLRGNPVRSGRLRISALGRWYFCTTETGSKLAQPITSAMKSLLSSQQHNTILVILSCALIVFVGLGSAEIQPWDEALFAMRAKAIIQHPTDSTVWQDQTQYAPGGLYSSTYPPLTVWAMVVCTKLAGVTPLGIRLFSALCSVATLFLLYQIALRMFTSKTALIAPVLLAGCLLWNNYARQGMSDVPLVMFFALALFALLRTTESTSTQQRLLWSGLFALAVAGALLTKIVVSVIPILFLFYFVFTRTTAKQQSPEELTANQLLERIARSKHLPVATQGTGLFYLLGAACVGIALALPWHLAMASRYGAEFTNAFLVPHLTSVVENNTRSLGVLYYVNQLLVASPVVVLTFYWFVSLITNRKNTLAASHNKPLELLLAAWFAGGLLTLSIAPTKMPHYTLLLLIPAILLGIRGFEIVTVYSIRKRWAWFVLATVVVTCVWLLSQSLRDNVQLLLHGHIHWDAITFVLLAVVLLCAGFIIPDSKRIPLLADAFPYMQLVVPAVLLLHVLYVDATKSEPRIHGAKETAAWLEDSEHRQFVYVYHNHNASDTLAPDLAWYTNGWTCGWQKRKSFVQQALPLNKLSTEVINALQLYQIPVVYATSPNDTLTASVMYLLSKQRTRELTTPNYVVFGAQTFFELDIHSNGTVR